LPFLSLSFWPPFAFSTAAEQQICVDRLIDRRLVVVWPIQDKARQKSRMFKGKGRERIRIILNE
jgi:hypothetical protein